MHCSSPLISLTNFDATDPDGSLGIHDMGDIWLRNYDSETFKDDIAALWENVKPLYEAVHAYTREKLYEVYGPEHVDPQGPIPAHLLGETYIPGANSRD